MDHNLNLLPYFSLPEQSLKPCLLLWLRDFQFQCYLPDAYLHFPYSQGG